MASSSSSSQSSAPASFDVFLSFRGEDTRKTFVDHLYSTLIGRVIYTYKDDENLPRGVSIGPSLLKAIRKSRIAVIIFSKNYADSSWCLDELEYIMKCKDETGLIVMPVFYDVDPSEVRKQQGDFGKGFSKQGANNFTKIESWRKTLVDASNLSGWEPKNVANGHESKVIKEIADAICDRLFPSASEIDDGLVGMKTRSQEMIAQLEMGPGDVHMVGIWGIGGVGKTTLATSVYTEISHQFEGSCIVENIREESGKNGLKKLQEGILSSIFKMKVDVPSIIQGNRMMKTRLRYKKVLILLDDVDKLDQLQALAGSHKWFGGGSRIIITTRDEHLLKAHKVNQVCDVRLLSNDEAIRLFNIHAYNENNPIKEYEKLSLRVVKYASGLPLALKVLGSFLYDKDEKEWMSALDRLKDIPEMEIVEKLKISYDGLNTKEKELFLDIACFLRGEYVERQKEALEACGYHPCIGIKILREKGLITINMDKFDMHDLIQEMGHFIVRGENPDNPKKHSRVWKHEEIYNMCSRGAIMENDKIEAIQYKDRYHGHVHSSRLCMIVSNMKQLRWLKVNIMDGKYDGGPSFLSNELKYIYWKRYPTSPFPESFQPVKLGVLELSRSRQKELWMGYKHLPHLKVLVLRRMENLLRTPDFSGLPCLRKFILNNCPMLEEIHPSLGYHSSLEYVRVSVCWLRMFPTIVRMEKLKTLDICECRGMKSLQLGDMDNLLSTPSDFRGLPCLQKFILNGCPMLEEIHPSLGYHSSLEYVEVLDCERLRMFPTIVQIEKLDLPHLKVLQLMFMRNLLSTPDFFWGLPCLQEFILHECPKLEEIHPSLGYHTSLEYVEVSCCERLRMFPRIVQMEKLKTLEIEDCDAISEFPKIQANMESLVKLSLKGTGIRVVPSDIGELSNLQELDLRSNKQLTRIDFSLSQLTRLKFLYLSECESLVELPKLPSSLAILRAGYCESLMRGDIVADTGRLLESMLQGNAIDEDHSMLLQLDGGLEIAKGFIPRLCKGRRCTLQLPNNWCDDFCGFLMCAVLTHHDEDAFPFVEISMKQPMMSEEGMDSRQNDVVYWEGEGMRGTDAWTWVGYIPFGSLRHTSWWATHHTYNTLSFSFDEDNDYLCSGFGVRLVSRNSSNNARLTETSTDSSSQLSDYNKPHLDILHDSASDLRVALAAFAIGFSLS